MELPGFDIRFSEYDDAAYLSSWLSYPNACDDFPFTFEEKDAIELSHCFVEFRPWLGKCKFRECRHLDEPDCEIRQAVEAGVIAKWRYRSYLGILLGATGREGRIRNLPLDFD